MTTATIRYFQPRSLLIGLVMLLAAGLAVLMTPTRKMADGSPAINLEVMIPKAFGEWKVDESAASLPVAPDVKAKLDRIYSQTLARTYVNGKGERVMLSIAYGGDQSDSMQVHRPEVCYPSQGFEILSNQTASVVVRNVTIPVVRLIAKQKSRVEPITYWITVGDKPVIGTVDRKLAQLRYSITGRVPDGLLFRVSSIDIHSDIAFEYQMAFVESLLGAVDKSTRKRFIGVE